MVMGMLVMVAMTVLVVAVVDFTNRDRDAQ